ncbi:very long chain fatty acid elongase F-like [Cochliomyia hominivorax]
MLLIKIFWSNLTAHFNSIGKDPRTNELPISNSYSLIILIITLYILLVLKIGPQFMDNRKPFNLKSVIQFYNIFQFFMNLYIFYGLTRYHFYSANYNWKCMRYDPTDVSPISMRKFVYLYFINKILDWLETIFFCLRKKFKQISFLHVYHHTIMVWAAFIYINLFYGSQFTVVGHINSFVHVLMYAYYFLSTLDINLNMQSMKKFMTSIQILQFFYFSVKMFVTISNNSWCGLSNFYLTVLLIQNIFMTAMFTHFYWKTYVVKARHLNSNVMQNK